MWPGTSPAAWQKVDAPIPHRWVRHGSSHLPNERALPPRLTVFADRAHGSESNLRRPIQSSEFSEHIEHRAPGDALASPGLGNSFNSTAAI